MQLPPACLMMWPRRSPHYIQLTVRVVRKEGEGECGDGGETRPTSDDIPTTSKVPLDHYRREGEKEVEGKEGGREGGRGEGGRGEGGRGKGGREGGRGEGGRGEGGRGRERGRREGGNGRGEGGSVRERVGRKRGERVVGRQRGRLHVYSVKVPQICTDMYRYVHMYRYVQIHRDTYKYGHILYSVICHRIEHLHTCTYTCSECTNR